MLKESKPAETARDYRQFLADSLEKRRQAFLKYHASVLKKPKPDPVHDLRVTIRRFNAILSLLQKIGQSEKSDVRKDLKNLMAPLGKLRDIQVRAEWIEKFSPGNKAVAKNLIKNLQDEENLLITAIPDDLKAVPLDRITGFDVETYIEPVDRLIEESGAALSEVCLGQLSTLLDRFAERVARFNDTGDVADMHRARIAFKKFRYTIEIFLPFYPRFDSKELNAFQTRLGNIRDLDLLIEWLKTLEQGKEEAEREGLEKLRKKVGSDRDRRFRKVEKGLKGDTKLVRKWRNQMKKPKGLKKKKSPLKEMRPEVVSLCERFDPDPPHAKYVSGLALKLFDELAQLGLHDLGDRHRTLLDYGCLLHDIGWVDGQRKHHKRSFEMIMESDLPMGRQNKLVVALIARFHRKADPDKKGSYHTLQPRHRQAIGVLAAIIRLADVLDRLHDQKAKIKDITLGNDEVVILVSPGSLANIPDTAIIKKTAFFPKAFGMPVRIIEEIKS